MIKQIIITSILIFVFVLKSNAQEAIKKVSTDTSTTVLIEIPPSYPGGYVELIKYINKKITYANEFDKNNQRKVGTVKLSFVIEKDGSVGDTIKVTQSLNEYYDKEAVRIIMSLPKWSPGTQNGNPARTQINLPVIF